MASLDPDYDVVIDTFTEIWPRYEKLGFDGLTRPEQVIFCTWQFVCEVNNGGIHQFFTNPSGEFAQVTVAALREAQMPYAASLLSRALVAFPRPVKDHELRSRQVRALPRSIQNGLFEELTRAFFDSPENAYVLQAEYVRRNQQSLPATKPQGDG